MTCTFALVFSGIIYTPAQMLITHALKIIASDLEPSVWFLLKVKTSELRQFSLSHR